VEVERDSAIGLCGTRHRAEAQEDVDTEDDVVNGGIGVIGGSAFEVEVKWACSLRYIGTSLIKGWGRGETAVDNAMVLGEKRLTR
jgi:hypothetical protein